MQEQLFPTCPTDNFSWRVQHKIKASMLLVAMETIRMYRGTNSVATLFTSGGSCNACHLPAVLQTIPLEKDIQPPPGRAPPTPNTHAHTQTHALQCGFAKAAGGQLPWQCR